MNRYQNEDVAWLRLQDMQREAENRRLTAGGGTSNPVGTLRRLFGRRAASAQRESDVRQPSA
jgi:hypothetical protein